MNHTESNCNQIELRNRRPFGVGGRRECFEHPFDSSKCIKILRTDERRTLRCTNSSARFSRYRQPYDNNADEHKQLTMLYKRLGSQMAQHLPICHGYVNTDLGKGLSLDLVRDHSGAISRTLRELLAIGLPLDELQPAYDQFAQFLTKHHVITRNIHDHNLVAKHNADSTWTLFLIDGFGDSAWISFSRWYPPAAAKRIRTRISTAWKRLEQYAASGGVSQETRQKASWDHGFLRHRGEEKTT